MQEVEDATDTEYIAGLIIHLSGFTELEDFGSNESKSAAAVVVDILVL